MGVRFGCPISKHLWSRLWARGGLGHEVELLQQHLLPSPEHLGQEKDIPMLTAGKPRHGPTSDPLSDNPHHRCPHSSPAPSRSQAAFMERNCVSDAADGARSSPEPEFCLAEPRTVTRHEVALCDRARDSHPGAFIPHPGAGDVRAPLPA